jgi:uncharacterized protein
MPDDFEGLSNGGEDPEDLDRPPSFFPSESGTPDREPGALGELVEVQIDGVYMAETNGQTTQFVLVSDGERKLPILIGPFEAQAIQLPLENRRPDRPLTHDLIRNILDRLNQDLDRVVIDDLWNGVYYAKLYLKGSGSDPEIEIDARPSDAIALAVRFDAPIYVADGILEAGLI